MATRARHVQIKVALTAMLTLFLMIAGATFGFIAGKSKISEPLPPCKCTTDIDCMLTCPWIDPYAESEGEE